MSSAVAAPMPAREAGLNGRRPARKVGSFIGTATACLIQDSAGARWPLGRVGNGRPVDVAGTDDTTQARSTTTGCPICHVIKTTGHPAQPSRSHPEAAGIYRLPRKFTDGDVSTAL